MYPKSITCSANILASTHPAETVAFKSQSKASSCFRRWISPALLASFILGLATAARATTAIMPSDDQMIIASRAIIRAKVISQQCGFDSRHDLVYTYVTVRVKEVLKGEITSREIVLKEPGGQVGDRGTVVFGSPSFTSGEEVVLYLDTWADGSPRVHEMFLGKFTVIRDQYSGQRVAIRQAPGPHVEIIPLTPLNGGPAQAGTSTSRLELSAYLRMVRKSVAANAEESRQFDQTYYRGASILAEPPDYQDIARSGGLQPQFHLFDNARWFEPDSGQPVTYLVNPDQAPNPQVSDDINAAMRAWSTVQACSLQVINGGTTSSCLVGGHAVADFNNCLGFFSAGGGCQGILAEGGFNLDGSQTTTVNGTTFVRIVVGFLSLNPYAACYFGDHCNLQEVVTHEMGHSLGLAHSWDPSDPGTPTAEEQAATMFYQAHFDGRCASIKTDDMNGIRFIYPGSGGGPLPPSISTTTLTSGTVGVPYAAILAATGGTVPYTWSLGPGSGPLPPGLALNTSGVISGTPTTSGNFGFTVVVTDAATHTAQADLSILISGAGGGGGVGGFNSRFVSQSVATSVQPSQTFQITIVWNNIGTLPWNGGNVNLGSQNPPNNTTWGTAELGFSTLYTVNPNVQVTMSFAVSAPAVPGVYQFQWQLIQDTGVGFFGDKSPSVAITVGTPNSAPPQVDTTITPSAQLGMPYSLQLAASGGTPPYSWTMSAGGDLPPGLALGLLSGIIAGTPTASGNFNFTVKVTDARSVTAQRSLLITVSAPPLLATAPSLPTAITGTAFSQHLSASGGLPPYSWSVTAGSFPAGLTLDPATGTISGTPSAEGSFNFTATVADAQSARATAALNLHILVVGPEAVPHIDAAKYRPGPGKLIITGQNFDPAAIVLVDQAAVTIRNNTPTQLLIKGLALATGAHVITVVNPNGVPPSSVTLTVN